MRKQLIVLASAAALATAPAALGQDKAYATHKLGHFLGGVIAGAIIANIIQANQYHCHGNVCHSHGPAGPYHYHDAYGRILYQRPVVVAPPPQPAYGGYPQAHYNWCAGRYASYDAGSNTFQPYGNVPRKPCISPYM